MKIAFLNIYQGRVNRGLETYVSELTQRLRKRHIVKIFKGQSEEIKRWPILWRLYLDPHGIKIALFTLKIIPEILKEKYDVVIPLNGGWQPAIVRLLTWTYGGKMIIPGQSGRGWDDRNNIWSMPDVFIGLSDSATKWARQNNPLIKSVTIPNGVDTKKFSPNGESIVTNLKKPVVLCVGALTRYKRIELAIKAVSKIKTASLLVVGDGEIRSSIENLGNKLLNGRFTLLKFPYEKMPGVYRAGDVLTLPSEPYEAFGNVIVEAMSVGLPIVATDDPTRRAIVGEAGIFVNPENVDLYAKNLEKAINKHWGKRPRLQAENFSWDKIAEQYEKLFKDLLGK